MLNIIAELKVPNRAKTIDFLKGHGFLCVQYKEAYEGQWASDVPISISTDPLRFNIHHPYAEGNNWGRDCDDPTGEDSFEVCVFAPSPYSPYARCPCTCILHLIVFMTVVFHCRITGLFVKMPRSAFGAVETVTFFTNESERGARTHMTQHQKNEVESSDRCVGVFELIMLKFNRAPLSRREKLMGGHQGGGTVVFAGMYMYIQEPVHHASASRAG